MYLSIWYNVWLYVCERYFIMQHFSWYYARSYAALRKIYYFRWADRWHVGTQTCQEGLRDGDDERGRHKQTGFNSNGRVGKNAMGRKKIHLSELAPTFKETRRFFPRLTDGIWSWFANPTRQRCSYFSRNCLDRPPVSLDWPLVGADLPAATGSRCLQSVDGIDLRFEISRQKYIPHI